MVWYKEYGFYKYRFNNIGFQNICWGVFLVKLTTIMRNGLHVRFFPKILHLFFMRIILHWLWMKNFLLTIWLESCSYSEPNQTSNGGDNMRWAGLFIARYAILYHFKTNTVISRKLFWNCFTITRFVTLAHFWKARVKVNVSCNHSARSIDELAHA